jgi:ribosome-associated protein
MTRAPGQLPPMPSDEIAPGVHAPGDALRLQYSRSSGPGGQNVNKVNTKVELWVCLSKVRGMAPDAVDRLRQSAGRRLTALDEIHLVADDHRTQDANRQEVFRRLRELIVQAQVRPRRRRKTRPSASSRKKRLKSKRHRSELKANRKTGDGGFDS